MGSFTTVAAAATDALRFFVIFSSRFSGLGVPPGDFGTEPGDFGTKLEHFGTKIDDFGIKIGDFGLRSGDFAGRLDGVLVARRNGNLAEKRIGGLSVTRFGNSCNVDMIIAAIISRFKCTANVRVYETYQRCLDLPAAGFTHAY